MAVVAGGQVLQDREGRKVAPHQMTRRCGRGELAPDQFELSLFATPVAIDQIIRRTRNEKPC